MCLSARERALPFDWSRTIGLTEHMYGGRRGRAIRDGGPLPSLLLLAAAQTLIAMIVFRILQVTDFVEHARNRRPHAASIRVGVKSTA